MAIVRPSRTRDLVELIFGYGMIVGIIWTPERLQRVLTPVALLLTLLVVLAHCHNRDELGLGARDFVGSLWILPAAAGLAALSIFAAAKIGTLHPLYKADFAHISGYVLWTIYQQFLLQNYFMDRLLRLVSSEAAAVTLAGTLFAAAHLPNLVLAAATLLWGVVSCALFRRYHNLWALGLAQGLLGLCFAICVPDALHHHLRVGLGFLRYQQTLPVP
ncbi:MAG TPA: CPBP family intramembrane glutamic endopeptidase [Candidatus Polarisedimenticolia bacterium]|nr:CPBP family intramembrane glutamic endopeptidase [Candidatus Polarisedimenticolia bacterium]